MRAQRVMSGTLDPKQKIVRYHYLHCWPAGNGTRVYTFESAIVVISRPGRPMPKGWWELSRLWAPNRHRKNLLTQAISHAVRQFHRDVPDAHALLGQPCPRIPERVS
jgi:hypothetical protein